MTTIFRVAVPSPLRQMFDYLPPPDAVPAILQPGVRLRVPFGRREMIGVLMTLASSSEVTSEQLRAATGVLDDKPVFSAALLELIQWASDYYQHPIGECVANALPVLLRKGEDAVAREVHWRLSVAGLALPQGALKRAPQQALVLAQLQQHGELSAAALKTKDISAATLRAMLDKGLVERFEAVATHGRQAREVSSQAPTLTDEQRTAIDAIATSFGGFRCHLLEGVTGSGKTEVYLRLIEQALARGEQTLVLVPEIGLTPQTLARFQRRLATEVVALHSGLNDTERLQAWRSARGGRAGVLLGTRSAVFADFDSEAGARLGLVIIDEEHDASYKQQDGFRYSARDIAIKRAAELRIPIVLGSATPSLETLHNALSGRYAHWRLHARAGGAAKPHIEIVDIRHAPMRDGLSPRVIELIGATLKRGEQALVFLNRRGFAPTLLCHDCGWIAQCPHCDTRLTVHASARQLRCHHCDYREPLVNACPSCKSPQLEFRGPGTERLEIALCELFRDTPVIRIDRDTTQRKHALRDKIAEIKQQQPCILVGTQMLAKGHHFPAVTLVVMVDIDGALFSADLRGPERMGQVLTQVAGRAGRAEKVGRVLVQTHYPDHEHILALVREGYHDFARKLLVERRLAGAPPFAYFAMLRADARTMADAEHVLAAIREHIGMLGVQLFGPLPAPLSRRAGMYRSQLLLAAPQRAALHRAVQAAVNFAEQLPAARRVRWSVDIDPVDFS
ncbi:MAG TPA: primosomal protein N' [Spongiibacteraceae bacterium]|nr:primosomal protein N' [Spongiibacteraceae bacterium]